MGVGGSTFFRVQVRGIDDSAVGKIYGAHLHQGPMRGSMRTAQRRSGRTTTPPSLAADGKTYTVISDQTEVWLDFEVDPFGNARSTARVPFVPTAGERSITLHASPTAAPRNGNRTRSEQPVPSSPASRWRSAHFPSRTSEPQFVATQSAVRTLLR